MGKKIFRLLFIGAVLFSFTGCAVKLPPVETYVLSASQNVRVNASQTATSKVLVVNSMEAAPGYQTSNMIYVATPENLQNFSLHQWVAPPAQMFLPIIAAHIDAKKVFKAVLISPTPVNSDFQLNIRLMILQQEFIQPVSQVRCVVQAVLINSNSQRIIAARNFQSLVPAPGNNPYSGVMAANQAANEIAQQVAKFVIDNAF